MDVSVIIVNYNTEVLTLQCLKSIFERTSGIEFEVIVVDNASSDHSVECIKRAFPQVLLIESNENLGFGRANNLGVQRAIGEYLFFLNSDTILLNNAIKILFDFNKIKSANIGVIGGILLDLDGVENASFGIYPTIANTFLSALHLNKHTISKYTALQEKSLKEKGCCCVEYVMGADMFVSKHLFDSVDGFDPAFFMFYEESDLQLRLWQLKQKKHYIVSEAKIIHLISASISKKENNNKRIIMKKSMLQYFKKHKSVFVYMLFKYLFLFIQLFAISKYSRSENRLFFKTLFKV